MMVNNSAILVCDMWDKHWDNAATKRSEILANKINLTIKDLRKKGYLIVHAPSDVVDYYKNTPARKRVLKNKIFKDITENPHIDPPLPIDDSDGGSDCDVSEQIIVWSRQNPIIEIDQKVDIVSDSGREIFNYLFYKQISKVYICGVHVNMCILDRTFGIKQMVRWGVDISWGGDLTGSMYNSKKRPFVSHKKATKLVVDYIDKYWCPVVSSKDLIG